MRAAIYAQYGPGCPQSANIGAQVARCRRVAEECGFKILDGHVYSDVVSSASQRERVGLWALLAAAHGRQVEVVIVDDLDHLLSNSGLPVTAIVMLDFFGARVIAVQDGIDTATEQGQSLIQIVYLFEGLSRGKAGSRPIHHMKVQRGEHA